MYKQLFKDSFYLDRGVFEPSEYELHYKLRLVKTRKDQECCICKEKGLNILKGSKAIYESCFLDGSPVSCYTCLKCADETILQGMGMDRTDLLEDEYFTEFLNDR